MRTPALRPPESGSLSSWPVFALLFAALELSHLPFLRLPYFWDEAGYFIPAARDLLLTGDLIPHTTLSNAHPPLVMLWLAFWWKLTTYSPLVTRTAMLLVAAAGLTALWRIGCRVSTRSTAAAAVLLTALSPTIFVQSAMAQLDIAAFALVLWMLDAYLRERRWQLVALAALAAIAKETTVPVTLTLAGIDLAGWLGHRYRPAWAAKRHLPRRTLRQCAALFFAPLPLAAWYGYHFHRTGHFLGNPAYLRYNVGATLTPWRILISFGMRVWHAVGYMNLFVLTAAALLLLWSGRRRDSGKASTEAGADGIAPRYLWLFALVVLAQVAEFSFVGGALLARYMIPALPFVILPAVDVVRRRAPRWQWWIAACAAAFLAALLFNPPWAIAPEDNLTWARFVRMHQDAAHYLEAHYAGDRILTAWPASDELSRPFLGYVTRPLGVEPTENFTAGEVLRAEAEPQTFDVVLAFSTKFTPSHRLLPPIPAWSRAQTRYFDYHRDLPPEAIARLLDGRIVWRESSPGEWIAVIEINKARNAALRLPPPTASVKANLRPEARAASPVSFAAAPARQTTKLERP